jgi:2TM domain
VRKEAAMDNKTVDAPRLDQDREPGSGELREQAITELRKRQELGGHVLAYVLVNGFLVMIWMLTGAGFFWPAFPMFGWGIGLAFHAWDVLWPQPSEQRIRSRMDEISRR